VRTGSIINFVLVTSATACLMGIVTNPDGMQENLDASWTGPQLNVLPPDTPETKEEDPLIYDFKQSPTDNPVTKENSKLYLEDPPNIKTDVQYDPKTGQYNIQQKLGDRNYRPATYMDPKEFQKSMFRRQTRDYWRSRVAADDLNEKPRQGLIPPLKINSELFDRIFGGNTVDIKPTGTAELIFGLTHNSNLNPAIPQRQQSMTNFDFNMRIQLNLIGKIGDKLKITTNYNTEATFDWENQVKVDYTGYEDDIIKKIEAGNVTLPLNSSLISGSQTLFGFKTELQFGKLRATTIFSQQKGKKQEISVQGGAQMQTFNFSADNYEQNKHFYLGHYFRRKYDTLMASLPVINSPFVITKVEVYLLGVNGSAEQTRNIVAFEDLGENAGDISPNMAAVVPSNFAITDSVPGLQVPHNHSNNLYAVMTNSVTGMIRNRKIDEVSGVLGSSSPASNPNNSGQAYMDAGKDYNIIRNARRLNTNEFTYNSRTGIISLNQQLNNEQALAVSYQFTYGGRTYQVGEFTEQVPDNTQLLVCKLLKSTVVNVRQPVWKLMMKNVYNLSAYNLNPTDFRLDVYYNNIETAVDVPYLPVGKTGGQVNGVQLIRVLNCDRLSVNGDKHSDGVFDFVNGYTIMQSNGRAYFPTSEPFGRSLAAKFDAEDFPEADKYIFYELYDSTKTAASFLQNKNRFKIKGSYRSSSGSEITLNALNIPQGAVVVTANGVTLAENTDYTVDYTLGRVKIINEGILNSGATIKVSLESNSLFNVQQKSLWGTRLDYKVNRDLTIGGTFLQFSERPLTQKVTIGDEPVSNIVMGLDVNHKTDAPFLTRLLDRLPFYSTKEMSTITTRAEIAKLFPGNASAISKNGGNSYIDDFEGSIALIDIKNANSWYLSSIPENQPARFKEASLFINPATGFNRARLSWYNVDAMFTRDQGSTTPGYYTSKKLFSNNMWRQVFETELFPGKTPPNGQQVVLPMLDLAYFPAERGPYNYDVLPSDYSKGVGYDGKLNDPQSRWAGIMRRLETNDFQAANVEYIQFWLMDPYNEDYNKNTDPNFDEADLPEGDLYINLGNISEDIVKDGRMVYENGLPGQSEYSQDLKVEPNKVANVPVLPPVINAFSQDPGDRANQDVGYDGLDDETERSRFADAVTAMTNGNFSPEAKQQFQDDPSSDRYHFFRGDDYDKQEATTLQRYARYNNPEGNSPTEAQYNNANPQGGNYSTGASTYPNIEDINRDNTLSNVESYYQYHVRISKSDITPTSVGTNFIVDAFNGSADFSGETKTVKWYQFKIPVSQFEDNIGGIEGFNSIRFMRVYMKNFDRPVLLRLARFELVRSDWRRYQYDLRQPGEYLSVDNNSTSFDVSAVSLQENSNKVPVNYVMPPDIDQQQNVQTTNLVLLNEQALQMRICDLKDGDSRAIFRNVDLDTRMFKNIKMNVHAEAPLNSNLKDDDLILFFRVGTDYNNNFYEYSLPLKLTPKGAYDPNNADARRTVWPAENEVNFKFDDISNVKDERNRLYGDYSNLGALSKPYVKEFGGYSITIVGNPNLGTVKSIMVGVRNPKDASSKSFCTEVWINELRLTDFNNAGGWATTGQVQAKLADLGMLSLAGTYKTPFWGGVESKINDRSRETNINWDVTSSMNAGKFFPDKWKVTLPLFYNFGQTKNIPLFNPLDPDVRFSDMQNNERIDAEKREDISAQVIDFTERKGFNMSNVRIEGNKNPKKKAYPWDPGNFTFTYAYSEVFRRSVNVEYNYVRNYRGNIQYAFALKSPPVFKPFAKNKRFDKKWLALIKDINLQLLPNSFGMSLDGDRTYTATKNRDITSFYAGSTEFANPALVNKMFLIRRGYNFRWDFSKAVKFDYTATNEGRILEPFGESWKSDKEGRRYVTETFFNGRDTAINDVKQKVGQYGENTVYRQQMNLNVDVPLNKIPVLDFIKTTYRYSGSYTWMRRPFAANDSIGNTIQNKGDHSINANLSMTTLYNKIPFLRRLLNSSSGTAGMKGPSAPGKKGDAVVKDTLPKKTNNFKDFGELLGRAILMLKNVSATYSESRGQALPNFKPSSQYGGMDFRQQQAPGFLFTTGLYDPEIRQNSVDKGWLANFQSQTTPYTETFSRAYNYKASLEPHGSLRIDLTGNYSYSYSKSEYIVYDNLKEKFLFNESPSMTGQFNITTMTLLRTFSDGGGDITSLLFDEFLIERDNIARELKNKNGHSQFITAKGIVDGYSPNQQDVLLGAFNRVYTGRDVSGYNTKNIFPTVPLPNWTVTWDGIGKLKKVKKHFKSVTIRHGYKSTYGINNFQNNLYFNTDGKTQNERMPFGSGADSSGTTRNFVPYYLINSVTISERFEPLIKFDFVFVKPGWSANFEIKRDKTTNLNLTGFQVIETKGQEYVIGIGYLYPRLKFKKLKIQGKPLESNLTVKVDVGFRRNVSILRQITDGSSAPTAGSDIITVRSSADYQLTQNVTLRLFYDYIRTTPLTSATFPTANTSGGFSLRINFQ
jgi:cell surface protein SprA